MNKITKNCFINSYFYFTYNYLLIYNKNILLYRYIPKMFNESNSRICN